MKAHPTILCAQLELLWSINERLHGNTGKDVQLPNFDDIMEDVLSAGIAEAEAYDELEEQMHSRNGEEVITSDSPMNFM